MPVAADVKSQFLSVADIVLEPRSVFEKIRDNREGWVFALAVLAILYGLVEYEQIVITFAHLQGLPQTLHGPKFAALGTVFAAVMFVVRVMTVAAIVWLGAKVAALPLSFIKSLALVVAIQTVFVMHGAALVAAQMFAKGLHAQEIGLNLAIPASYEFLRSFLAVVNPFSLWYAVLLMMGVSTILGCTRRQACQVLLPYLVGIVALAALRAHFSPAMV